MKTSKSLIFIISLSLCLFYFGCNKDSSNPVQQTTGGDTVQTLTPGTAAFYCEIDQFIWSMYTGSGNVTKIGDTIKITSSISYVTGHSTVTLNLYNITDTTTLNIGPNSVSYIQYDKTIYGIPDSWTTKYTGGSGSIIINYFNLSKKTLKATFSGYLKNSSFSKTLTNGVLKATWQ
jgi:hypothetical protein